MQFHIEKMHCGGCARAVTAAIRSVDPAASVTADPESRSVKVETTSNKAALERALADAGFPADAA